MKRKVDRNKVREYTITSLVVVCSAVLLYFSVSTLQENQDVQTVFNLDKKRSVLCIRYNEFPVSFLEVLVLSDEIDSVVFKGSISSSNETPHTFSAQLSFNPLFQLYTAFLKIHMFEEYEFQFSLQGVKISELIFSLKKSDQEMFSTSLDVPGPVLMSQKLDTDETFDFAVLFPSRLLARSDIVKNEITKVSKNLPSHQYLSKDFTYSEVESSKQCPLETLPEELRNLDHRLISSIEKMLSQMFRESS